MGARAVAVPRGRGGRWWTVAAMALPLGILTIDFFGITVALPDIGRDLGVSTGALEWVINAFMLAFAAPLLAVGRLGDLIGRRKVLIGGTVIYAVASLLGGSAPNEWVLIAARAGQGFGAAVFFVNSLSIVSNAFPKEQRAMGIGIWTAAGAVGQSIGPLVGGFLTQTLSWRWFFYVNIPIAVATVLLTLAVVEESKDETATPGIDYAGFIAVTAGFVLLVLGIQESNSRGWGSPIVLGGIAAGIVVLALFVLIERRVRNPLVVFGLFKGGTELGAVGVAFLANFGFGAVMFFLTLYIQHVLDYSPIQTGFIFLAFTIPFATLSPLAGRASGVIGARLALVVGMGLISASFVALLLISPTSGLPLVLIGLLIFGVGQAFAYNVSTAAGMAEIPEQQSGEASGAQNTVRQMGTVFGVAITGALFKALENDRMLSLLSRAGVPLSGDEANEVRSLLSGSESAQAGLAQLAPAVVSQTESIVRDAFVHALDGAMILCLVLSLLGVAAAMAVKPKA